MLRLRLWLGLVLLAVAGGTAQAQSFPPLSGRVVDAANLLDPAQEAELTRLSADIEKASGRQFVVATIPDLQDYPIEDYGYRLGRAWKIGQGQANNGIILIVAPAERKVRIEVGYGLEPVMTDALANSIIQTAILPRFRDGDMAGGIVAGAKEIGEQMKLPLEAAEARAKEKLDAGKGRIGEEAKVGVLIAIGVFFVIFVVLVSAAAGGRRGRRYRGGSGLGQVLLWAALDAAMHSGRGGGGSGWGGGDGGGWGGGGFSGGGGSFGGGGASGSW